MILVDLDGTVRVTSGPVDHLVSPVSCALYFGDVCQKAIVLEAPWQKFRLGRGIAYDVVVQHKLVFTKTLKRLNRILVDRSGQVWIGGMPRWEPVQERYRWSYNRWLERR